MEEVTEVLIERSRMLYDIWFTDECHFWMNGYVNTQNMCLQCDKKSYKVEKTKFHPEKLIMWFAFSSHGLTGPFFSRNSEEGILLI